MKHAVSKIFGCALAAAFVLTGCMGGSSGPAGQSGSAGGASSQSGQSSTVQTAAPEKWRAGLGVLTQNNLLPTDIAEVIQQALRFGLNVGIDGVHYFTPLIPVMSFMTSPAIMSPTTEGTNALLPGTWLR